MTIGAIIQALKVGEPVTRTITISARGLTAAQINPYQNFSDNFKLYPDQPKLDDQTDNMCWDSALKPLQLFPVNQAQWLFQRFRYNGGYSQQTLATNPSLANL